MTGALDFMHRLFESDFMPHGHCFFWHPELLWMHVVSDAVVAAAYFSIPIALVVIYRHRKDFEHKRVLVLFASFIFLCGLTHVLGIWTMWDPIYRAEGLVKAATALVSVVTAAALWQMIPQILSIPNPRALAEANEALRAEMEDRQLAEERFRKLLEAAPDAMLIVDEAGRIEVANERCESLFGYSKADLLGQTVELLVPEAVRDAHVGHRERYFRDAAPKPMGAGRELFGLRSDGTEFPVEISLSPLETPSGLLVSAAIRDISDRLRVQQRLKELNDELAKRVDDRTAQLAQRAEELARSNAELEQFAYIISHDLKSPMRGIASLSEWLMEDQSERLDDEGREQLRLLQQRAGRMHNMIEGVLEYSRAATNPVAPESIDPRSVIEEVIDDLGPTGNVSIEVGELPLVRYSRVQLRQVFQNLIGNALKHMGSERGTIEVSGREVLDQVEFRVSDDGVGIAPEHHERVFRIFQTLSAREGVSAGGLGLAIVKKIVERNGGRIYLESHPGCGTTFILTAPRSTEPDPAKAIDDEDPTSSD